MQRAVFAPFAVAFLLLVVGSGASSAAHTCSALTAASIPLAPAFTTAQLDAYPSANWLSVQGNLANDRHSKLTQITQANVSKHHQAWHIHLGDWPSRSQKCSGEEENATVYDGVMYLENVFSQVFAIDATNGKILWKYTPTFLPKYNNGP